MRRTEFSLPKPSVEVPKENIARTTEMKKLTFVKVEKSKNEKPVLMMIDESHQDAEHVSQIQT